MSILHSYAPNCMKPACQNLWIPRQVQCLESIRILASGKLDLTKCQELVTKN